MRILGSMIIAVLSCVAPVSAKPALSDVTSVNEGLITVGMADTIRKKCGRIDARILKALFFITSIESQAKKLGYSASEIKAYTDSDTEKARLLGIAHARLTDLGVTVDHPETYCTVGLAQIQAGTDVGKLLKAK